MMNHDTLEDKDTGEDPLVLRIHLQNQNQGTDHILSIIKFVSYTVYNIKKNNTIYRVSRSNWR